MTKIPVIDEVVRSVQSIGDAITGDTAAARRRWDNWESDSFLATAGKAGSLVLFSGVCTMVGETDKATKFKKEACKNGEKFGATAISSLLQVGRIAVQAATYGAPNPLSGALNGFASGVNRIVDEDAKRGTHGISWGDLWKEGGIGAASSGGIVPYAGTAFEKFLRGEKVEVDHREEWANCFINAALTVGTVGTVKGTAALTKAGKIGVKTAMAIGGTSGLAMGSGAAFISQEVQSAALERKMKKDGYKYNRDEKLDDGREHAVYTKEGEPDIYAPKPDLGDIVTQGVMHGVTTAVAVKLEVQKQLIQNESLPGPGDQAANRNLRDEQPQIVINNVNNGTQIINSPGSWVISWLLGGSSVTGEIVDWLKSSESLDFAKEKVLSFFKAFF
ncbi:uncharacterized protein [Montipora foliosa]|uniref:uncharacterized protein n=1 Tax=Montipora foliosa TaxID=591990 RepID=UPI0035F134C1